jgi:hypothetical protein
MKCLTSAGLFIAALLVASADAPARAAGSEQASTERFIVTYVKSSNVEHCPRILTAITVVNKAAISCNIRVDFFASSTPGTSACSIAASLGPGVASNFCSRNAIPTSNGTPSIRCYGACSPELTSLEGKALISTNAAAECANLGVATRVYYFDCDKAADIPAAISHSSVVLAK